MSHRLWLHLDFGPERHEYGVGEGLLAELGQKIVTIAHSGRCALVADAALAETPHLVVAEFSLKSAGFVPTTFLVPRGEASKSVAQAERLWNGFAEAGIEADGVVVALGGGVTGDLAGFCAAAWMRGVALVHAPTTVLAMCDSSVGGKCAVNLPAGKNLVGAFHMPRLVVADLATLATLPDRELRSGFAEVIKCALLADRVSLSRLRQDARALVARDPARLVPAIAAAVELKADHVRGDEKDRADRRAMLNLGHTTAHGIEAAQGYAGMLHGEAVAIGLSVAGRIAAERRLCDADRAREIDEALAAFGLPIALPPGLDARTVVAHTLSDKKRRGSRRRMVLPHARGGAGLYDVEDAELIEAIEN